MGTSARRLLAAGAALLLLGAACGDDDEDVGETGTTQAPDTTAGGEAGSLDLTAIDFGYEGASEVGAGAVTINLSNTGTEPHQAILFALNDGVEAAEIAAVTDEAGLAELGSPVGGPVAALPGAPAESATVQLDAGNYAVMCFIPSADGVPHFAKGMVAPLTVTEGEGAALPDGDETISARDFSFDVPDGFTGDGTVRFDNVGDQAHELAIVQLGDGATVDDVLAFFGPNAPAGPPPFSRITGVGSMGPGDAANISPSLTAGEYVALCFLTDPASGQPHFALGMQKQFTIG